MVYGVRVYPGLVHGSLDTLCHDTFHRSSSIGTRQNEFLLLGFLQSW